MPKPANELQTKKEASPALSVEGLISQAVAAGTPVETLERLLAMRRELRAEAAQDAFFRAMKAFQEDCPTVPKTRSVKTGSGATAYSYAPLEAVVELARPVMAAHGFSYGVRTETREGSVKVTCIARHEGGHAEESSFEAPLGTQTNMMSRTQVVAAAITFCKRQAFCNAFGILTSDEDTDAARKSKPKAEDGTYVEKIVKVSSGTDAKGNAWSAVLTASGIKLMNLSGIAMEADSTYTFEVRGGRIVSVEDHLAKAQEKLNKLKQD